MRIVGSFKLPEFWESKPHFRDAQGPLEAWSAETKKADWKNPMEIKKLYRSASILKGGVVVFNIKVNDYRLVTKINCPLGVVEIRFVGDHRAYDKINAEEV